jgi:Fe-S-cluster containining protein
MSLGCAGCGDCCNPVKVDFDQWARIVADVRAHDPAEVSFDGPAMREYWKDSIFLAGTCRPVGAGNGFIFLECANYDTVHQSCRAYEQRTRICRGFPWYGREPDGQALNVADSRCSYLLDVPPSQRPEGVRPLIPITPV